MPDQLNGMQKRGTMHLVRRQSLGVSLDILGQPYILVLVLGKVQLTSLVAMLSADLCRDSSIFHESYQAFHHKPTIPT